MGMCFANLEDDQNHELEGPDAKSLRRNPIWHESAPPAIFVSRCSSRCASVKISELTEPINETRNCVSQELLQTDVAAEMLIYL